MAAKGVSILMSILIQTVDYCWILYNHSKRYHASSYSLNSMQLKEMARTASISNIYGLFWFRS